MLYLLLMWNTKSPLFLKEMFPLPLSTKWQGAVLDNTTHATNILPFSAEKWRACYLGRSPWDHLAFYPLTAIQTQMPFMQVPEPCLFVLHNCYTPYLSTVILGPDGSLLAGASAVSVCLRLVTICSLSMSQSGEEKHFSRSLIIQPSPFEGLIS